MFHHLVVSGTSCWQLRKKFIKMSMIPKLINVSFYGKVVSNNHIYFQDFRVCSQKIINNFPDQLRWASAMNN